jgi:hypothetical protein
MFRQFVLVLYFCSAVIRSNDFAAYTLRNSRTSHCKNLQNPDDFSEYETASVDRAF